VTLPLSGKNALVTGGSRGIGRAIASRLRDDGATVTITGTGSKAKTPERCALRVIDFSDADATRHFASELADDAFDILVNNAGINKIGPFESLELEDFARIQQVNVTAPLLLMQAVVPAMRRKRWGRIVNIASIFSVVSKELRASYSASKFALDGMTAALAAEVAADGVLANCVSPGFIDTDLTRSILGESGLAELVARIPMRRLGKPEEIAAFVAWLVSEENTYISGQNLVIDGGFTRV
jgi:NAD(P)-dependent dehydrogenase (short-subunit alcohol dehydrogenase family)